MNESLQFAYPWILWTGLVAAGVTAFLLHLSNARRKRDLATIAHSRLLRQLTESFSRTRHLAKQTIWVLAILLLFAALARPQYGFEYREVKRRGIDIVFALDTSRSMLAEDVVPNRLERAKMGMIDFVERLEGDRVGLIPFAGNAFALCPLTLDYGAFRQSLDAIDTNTIPHQGTDLASAVREANRLFDLGGNNHRILVLITDGEDLEGEIASAISAAKEKGMVIHTVGVGDAGGAVIPITREDGSTDFVRDANGEVVRTSLDEETLREIATETGGIYAPLGRAAEGLDKIYREKLRLVPKSELNQRLDRIPLERYEWPLGAALFLLVIEFLLGQRKRRIRQKSPVISAARRRKLRNRKAVTTSLMFFVILAEDARAMESTDATVTYNSSTEAYREDNFEAAAAALGESLRSTTNLELQQRSYYNLGNTQYRLGQQSLESSPEETITKWEESIKSYEDALALNGEDEDARYNLDFVKKKLEELKKNREEENQEEEEQDQQKNQEEQKEENQSESQEDQGEAEEEEQQEDGASGEQEEEEEGEQSDASESVPSEENQAEENSGTESEETEETGEEEEQAAQPAQGGEEEKEDAQEQQPGSESSAEGESTPENPDPNASPQAEAFDEERREPGEMSEEEAVQLLESLKNDERSVVPLPDARSYRRVVPNNTTKGKTW